MTWSPISSRTPAVSAGCAVPAPWTSTFLSPAACLAWVIAVVTSPGQVTSGHWIRSPARSFDIGEFLLGQRGVGEGEREQRGRDKERDRDRCGVAERAGEGVVVEVTEEHGADDRDANRAAELLQRGEGAAGDARDLAGYCGEDDIGERDDLQRQADTRDHKSRHNGPEVGRAVDVRRADPHG